jgi:hypothetical protein
VCRKAPLQLCGMDTASQHIPVGLSLASVYSPCCARIACTMLTLRASDPSISCHLCLLYHWSLQGVLVVGDNLIAAEVHQGGSTSADAVFDMAVAYKAVRTYLVRCSTRGMRLVTHVT